jgi:hypothetical protein
MNEAIELHDSVLATTSNIGEKVVLWLRPGYVHRSPGCAGKDAGSGWHQAATITVFDGSISSDVLLPATISDGSLRIGRQLYDNLIPARGTFEDTIELWLGLSAGESLTVRGARLVVALQGEPVYIEEFNP